MGCGEEISFFLLPVLAQPSSFGPSQILRAFEKSHAWDLRFGQNGAGLWLAGCFPPNWLINSIFSIWRHQPSIHCYFPILPGDVRFGATCLMAKDLSVTDTLWPQNTKIYNLPASRWHFASLDSWPRFWHPPYCFNTNSTMRPHGCWNIINFWNLPEVVGNRYNGDT